MKEKTGRVLVCGDLHGNYKGFLQALERCNFNNETDTLISLGDVVDGHSQSFEVVEKLLEIKNLISIKGNHDEWFNDWILTGINPAGWRQGQDATGLSYLKQVRPEITEANSWTLPHLLKPIDIPRDHRQFFKKQLPYYLDNENRLFIHGGFNRHQELEEQENFVFWWDRDLWSQALSFKSMKGDPLKNGNGWKPKFKMKGDFKEVYIGHTSTQFWDSNEPMNAANIWNLDTGGGWFGYITIMDIDTKEFWQSDAAQELYPEFKGR